MNRIYNDPVDENDLTNKRYVDESNNKKANETLKKAKEYTRAEVENLEKYNKKFFNGELSMGEIVVEDISSKNVFNKFGDLSYTNSESSGTTTLEEDGTIKATSNYVNGFGPGQKLKLKPNTIYTCSFDVLRFETLGPGLVRICNMSNEDMGYKGFSRVGKYSFTFTTENEEDYYISLNGVANQSEPTSYKFIIYDNIQIEKGPIATKYSPYIDFKNDENDKTCSTNEIYSTDEMVIGTWVDGKPLYRKVYYFTSNVVSPSIKHNIENVDWFTSVTGMILLGNSFFPAGYVNNNGTVFLSLYCDRTTLYLKGNQAYDAKVYAILEYTKTTD